MLQRKEGPRRSMMAELTEFVRDRGRWSQSPEWDEKKERRVSKEEERRADAKKEKKQLYK